MPSPLDADSFDTYTYVGIVGRRSFVSSTTQALKALASLDDDQDVTVLGTVLGERSSFR